jgi:hypothetical protein
VDVEPSEEQGRRQYERDRIAWNLPAPKVRSVVLSDPDPAPVSEEPETSDELEPDPVPAA